MAYQFQSLTDGDYFDWGNNAIFSQDGDVSLTLWANIGVLGTLGHDDVLFNVASTFFGQDPIRLVVRTDVDNGGNGWGLFCHHVTGGPTFNGVNCVPGAIDPRYRWTPNQWLFFAFVRDSTAKVWHSYFGSRNALITAQFTGYGTNTGSTGAQFLYFGNGTHNELIGPLSYWRKQLSVVDITSLSKCIIPSDPFNDCLLFTKMNTQPAPVDLSSYAWHPNVHGSPNGPQFIKDDGCANFGAGQGWEITSTGA